MKVIDKNVANQLVTKSHMLRDRHKSWKCMLIRLSAKRGNYSQQLITHFFIRPTIDILEPLEGEIYICRDGDILIMFQGISAPVIDALVSQFGDLNAEENESGEPDMFLLYDLSVDYPAFSAMAKQKLHAALHYGQVSIPAARRIRQMENTLN